MSDLPEPIYLADIRKLCSPEISGDALYNNSNVEVSDVQGWLTKAIEGKHEDQWFNTEHNNWVAKCRNSDENKGLNLEGFAQKLKKDFLSRFYAADGAQLPSDNDGHYLQAITNLSILSADAAWQDVFAIILTAELRAQDPNGLLLLKQDAPVVTVVPVVPAVPISPEDAKLFSEVRDLYAKLAEVQSEKENRSSQILTKPHEDSHKQLANMQIHGQPRNEATNKGERPSIDELLHWADEFGLLLPDMKAMYAGHAPGHGTTPEQVLRAIKQAFKDKLFLIASTYNDKEINGIISALSDTVGDLPKSSGVKETDAKKLKGARIANANLRTSDMTEQEYSDVAKEREAIEQKNNARIAKGQLPATLMTDKEILASILEKRAVAEEKKVIKNSELQQIGKDGMSMEAKIATVLIAAIKIRERIEILSTPEKVLRSKKAMQNNSGVRFARVAQADVTAGDRDRYFNKKKNSSSSSRELLRNSSSNDSDNQNIKPPNPNNNNDKSRKFQS